MKNFSEMKFKKPDLKKIERDFDAIIWEFNSAETFEAQNKALKKMFKYSDKINTNFEIGKVKYTCDTQNAENAKNQQMMNAIENFIKEKQRVTYIVIDPLFVKCDFEREGWVK